MNKLNGLTINQCKLLMLGLKKINLDELGDYDREDCRYLMQQLETINQRISPHSTQNQNDTLLP